jgi:taurine--2-oxoglutarate transaminase
VNKIATKYDDVVLPLGLTYSAHPISCAAALETLKIYEDDNLIENAIAMGKYVDSKIEELKKETSINW